MSASDRKRLPAITGGPRAFPVMSEMPVGHTTVYIDDDRHWPHLKPGESALVDTTDREIVFGEVYVVRQSRGPCALADLQALRFLV
jgi:hypothetical protein